MIPGVLAANLLRAGGGGGGGGSPFPAGWSYYDPSDMASMFQDAAGTVPVTASGQPVGLLLDLSGNGRHFAQSDASLRPTFLSSWTHDGGSNAALFFAGDSILDCVNDGFATPELSVHFAANVRTGTTQRDRTIFVLNDGATRYRIHVAFFGALRANLNDGTSETGQNFFRYPSQAIYEPRHYGLDSVSGDAIKDGARVAFKSGTADLQTGAGAIMRIGANNANDRFVVMEMTGLVIAPAGVTDPELADIYAWMQARGAA